MLLHLRQLFFLTRAYFYSWIVTWHHAVLSLLLAIVYLSIINQSFVVTLTRRVVVGVHIKNADLAQRVRDDLTAQGLGVVAYHAPDELARALSNGLLAAAVQISTNAEHIVVTFAGKSPLMDRELANVLFEMTGRVGQHARTRSRLTIANNSYHPDAMRAYITANLFPFLLLSLVIVNCGIVYVIAIENKALFAYLLTPVPRSIVLAAQLGCGIIVSLGVAVLAYALCMPVVGLPFPARPLQWLGVSVLQLFCNGALYLCVALHMRRYIPFAQFGMISVVVLIFIGGAITPFEVMPQWERVVAAFTPALYMMRTMRAVMLESDSVRLNDLLLLIAWGTIGATLGLRRLRHLTVA